MKKWAGTVAVLASAAGFATVAIFIKYAYAAGASTLTVLTARFALAALLLCAAVVLKGESESLRLKNKAIISLLLLGSCGYGLMAILFAASLSHVSASIGALLLYAYPALVALLAAFLGEERLNRRKGSALTICFAGLVFVLGVSFENLNLLGIALGLASAFVYACYIVFSSRLLKDVPPLIASTYVCASAAFLCLGGGLVSGTLNFILPLAGWLSLLGIAIFGTVIGILGFLLGMGRIGAADASIVSMVEPVITVLLSALLLGDRLTLPQFCGGGLILGGIVLLQVWAGRSGEAKPENVA